MGILPIYPCKYVKLPKYSYKVCIGKCAPKNFIYSVIPIMVNICQIVNPSRGTNKLKCFQGTHKNTNFAKVFELFHISADICKKRKKNRVGTQIPTSQRHLNNFTSVQIYARKEKRKNNIPSNIYRKTKPRNLSNIPL